MKSILYELLLKRKALEDILKGRNLSFLRKTRDYVLRRQKSILIGQKSNWIESFGVTTLGRNLVNTPGYRLHAKLG